MLSVMIVMINTSFKKGLQEYLNNKEVSQVEVLAQKVKRYYSPSSGWIRLVQEPYLWGILIGNPNESPPPPPRYHRRKPDALDNESQTSFVPLGFRLNLLDQRGKSIVGMTENLTVRVHHADTKLTKVAIKLDQKVIGYISIVQSIELSGTLAESFFKQQATHIFLVASITILMSFSIALLLVRHFLKPLSALSLAAQSIGKGELDFSIESKGSDELAELVRTFNRVVEVLRSQKETREQWLSDISHELRTPIAVLRSELEAIQDGIRAPEPQYIDSLHKQTLTLGALVEDLHRLSLSDMDIHINVSKEVVLNSILKSAIFQYSIRLEKKNIELRTIFESNKLYLVHGDEQSLIQLFTNLLENIARYTHDGGKAQISMIEEDRQVVLYFEDSAPSVPEQSLPKLFERLYRVDKSRSRESGGSGLGLSICQNIVRAHKGTIMAEHSDLGGLRIVVTLPRSQHE